jgi:hypothetical protein
MNSEGCDFRDLAGEAHDRQDLLTRNPRLQLQQANRPLTDDCGVCAVVEKNIKALFDPRVWPCDPDGDGA